MNSHRRVPALAPELAPEPVPALALELGREPGLGLAEKPAAELAAPVAGPGPALLLELLWLHELAIPPARAARTADSACL